MQDLKVDQLSDGFQCRGEAAEAAWGLLPFNGLTQDLNLSKWKNRLPTSLASLFVGYRGEVVHGIEEWDVSSVTDMSYTFAGLEEEDFKFRNKMNPAIGSWNVGQVQTMRGMFFDNEMFDQNLQLWSVNATTDMESMFEEASAFNGIISSWDVSQVQNMNRMFKGAVNFNIPLDLWKVHNVGTDEKSIYVHVFRGSRI